VRGEALARVVGIAALALAVAVIWVPALAPGFQGTSQMMDLAGSCRRTPRATGALSGSKAAEAGAPGGAGRREQSFDAYQHVGEAKPRWWVAVWDHAATCGPGSVAGQDEPPAALLLDAADHSPSPWLGTWTVLAAATGARNGELCGLEWADLDLDASTVRFRQVWVPESRS
jgi:hypothetical protein